MNKMLVISIVVVLLLTGLSNAGCTPAPAEVQQVVVVVTATPSAPEPPAATSAPILPPAPKPGSFDDAMRVLSRNGWTLMEDVGQGVSECGSYRCVSYALMVDDFWPGFTIFSTRDGKLEGWNWFLSLSNSDSTVQKIGETHYDLTVGPAGGNDATYECLGDVGFGNDGVCGGIRVTSFDMGDDVLGAIFFVLSNISANVSNFTVSG